MHYISLRWNHELDTNIPYVDMMAIVNPIVNASTKTVPNGNANVLTRAMNDVKSKSGYNV